MYKKYSKFVSITAKCEISHISLTMNNAGNFLNK